MAMLLLAMMLFITGIKALHHHHPEEHQLRDDKQQLHDQFRESHSYCSICDFNFSTLANTEDDRLESFGVAFYGCFGGYYKASACFPPCDDSLRLRGPPFHY